jgi:hypothetical protein
VETRPRSRRNLPFSGLSPCDLYGSNYASRSEDSLYRAADRGPAVISIAVTALRLVGELLHWPKPLINSDVCGKAGYLVGADLWDLLRGQALSCRRYATAFWPTSAFGDFGFGPKACRHIRDGIPCDDICFAAVDELHRYTDRACSVRHGVADTLQVLLAYGYLSRIPVAIVQYLAMRGRWGHTLRCVRSRISSHRLLANLSPRFLRPEHLFHGGLYGDCGCH